MFIGGPMQRHILHISQASSHHSIKMELTVRAINDWNAIPIHVVSASTVNQFKARLDTHWAVSTHPVHNPISRLIIYLFIEHL